MEKMHVKQYELKGVDACRAKRAFTYSAEEGIKEHVIKASAIMKALNDIFIDGREKDATRTEFDEAFDRIPYPSERQKNIHRAEAWRLVERFLNSEERSNVYAAKPDTISLSPYLDVDVSPTFIYLDESPVDEATGEPYYDGIVEVVKVKSGRPNINSSDADKNMEIYSMLKYGRKLVAQDKKMLVKASIYFLRKSNDTGETARVPNFDPDLFSSGGNNIISFSEEYVGGSTAPTTQDVLMSEVIDDFVEGLPKDECSPDDCRQCELFDVCHYEEPPLAIIKEPVVKSVSDITLTESQETAIEAEKGYWRINAGAGAGKTMIVALRATTLMLKGVRPHELLLITFTNAGAEEMRSRIELYNEDFGTGENIDEMQILTFNAFGNEVLKSTFGRFGFTAAPKVIDDVERSRIIANLLKENDIEGLDYRNFDTDTRNCKGALAIAREVFSIVKGGGYGLGDFAEVRSKLGASQRFATGPAVEALVKLYYEYDKRLREDNLIEYADQEMLLFEILKDDPYYFEQYGFKHIVVDEFQDTSLNQIEIVKKLCNMPTFESLMVVGDDMQAIFGFRDTSPEYMVELEKYLEHPVEDVFLMENHRSTPEVIDFANKIASLNHGRIPKDLVSTRASGLPVIVKGFHTKNAEQDYIVEEIQKRISDGVKPEDIAVIGYNKYELSQLATLLKAVNIPTVMLNPELMNSNSRVRAALSFFEVYKNDHATKDILTYINAKLGGGIMNLSHEEIDIQREELLSLIAKIKKLPPKERKEEILAALEEIDRDADEVYLSFLESLKVKASVDKMREYCADFDRFGSKAAYRRTHDYPGVVLTTAHSSKGLEWNHVFCTVSNFDTAEVRRSRNVEEERRRLLFVSATRARDELVITSQYIAYGKRGAYTHNMFLQDSFGALGINYDARAVDLEKEEIRKAEKAVRDAEKKKAAAELEELTKKLKAKKTESEAEKNSLEEQLFA